jgi:NAD(P)-dependent dehydrogenase (short-subunit alcohol dehydrogenase family)
VYQVNVFGTVRVTPAMLPLPDAAPAPTIVNVSSGLGSLAVTTDPDHLESSFVLLGYPSSKTALTMITTQYAKALPRFRVNAVDPGYSATDLNAHRGTQTVEEGAHGHLQMAIIGPDGPMGTFVDQHGLCRGESAPDARLGTI